jgi:hypothetical protein
VEMRKRTRKRRRRRETVDTQGRGSWVVTREKRKGGHVNTPVGGRRDLLGRSRGSGGRRVEGRGGKKRKRMGKIGIRRRRRYDLCSESGRPSGSVEGSPSCFLVGCSKGLELPGAGLGCALKNCSMVRFFSGEGGGTWSLGVGAGSEVAWREEKIPLTPAVRPLSGEGRGVTGVGGRLGSGEASALLERWGGLGAPRGVEREEGVEGGVEEEGGEDEEEEEGEGEVGLAAREEGGARDVAETPTRGPDKARCSGGSRSGRGTVGAGRFREKLRSLTAGTPWNRMAF